MENILKLIKRTRRKRYENMEFEIIRNDIVNMQVDAVVLPANALLIEGNGTSAAIFKKAGEQELRRACRNVMRKLGKTILKEGSAVATLGFGLDANILIHAVVPKWKNGKKHEYDVLSTAYLSSLLLADKMGCETMAFPLLASGNNGFDVKIAFEIAKKSIESYETSNKLRKVFLVVYDADTVDLVRKQGIVIKELINDPYVLEKDGENITPRQLVIDNAKDAWQCLKNDGLIATAQYLEKFQDPDFRTDMERKGYKIANSVLKNLLGENYKDKEN